MSGFGETTERKVLLLLAPAGNHGCGFGSFLLLFTGFGYKMSWSQRELAKRTKKKNEKRMKISIRDSLAASRREKRTRPCGQ